MDQHFKTSHLVGLKVKGVKFGCVCFLGVGRGILFSRINKGD